MDSIGRWEMALLKADLVDAVGVARRRATLRRKKAGLETEIVFAECSGGLSVRSSAALMDIEGSGVWTSPVAANGPALRRLVPKLSGTEVSLRYSAGRLLLNGTSIPAREL